MTTLIGPGQRVVFPAPAGGVQMDRMYRIGVFACVALVTAAEGEDAPFALGGSRTLPKAAGVAFAVGDMVFYDPTAHEINATGPGRFPVGGCIQAAAEADPRIRVRLFDQATAPIE
jgi:predicted RecA/RadA family phage recombinase